MLYFILHQFHLEKIIVIGGRDSSVDKSSSSQAGDLGSSPGGGLNQLTQCMNESGDYQL